MTIVGFSFNKILVEKKSMVKGKVNIKNNVSIKSVTKADMSLGASKQQGIKFEYEFTVKYEPDLGDITIIGDVLDLQPEKKVDEIVKEWEKNKKVDKAIMMGVLNTILNKCNVQALMLSRDVNLPPPIPLPKVSAKQATQALPKK